MPLKHIPIIGVMGSGAKKYRHLSEPVGRLIAELDCHLLTGGGSGVMAAVSGSFFQVKNRLGASIGILKGHTTNREDGRMDHHPSPMNEWIEIPIITHLPLSGTDGRNILSRNHINVLSADILIALPGGPGTRSEVILRIDYGLKVILFLGKNRIDGCDANYFRRRSWYEGQVIAAENIDELKNLLQNTLP